MRKHSNTLARLLSLMMVLVLCLSLAPTASAKLTTPGVTKGGTKLISRPAPDITPRRTSGSTSGTRTSPGTRTTSGSSGGSSSGSRYTSSSRTSSGGSSSYNRGGSSSGSTGSNPNKGSGSAYSAISKSSGRTLDGYVTITGPGLGLTSIAGHLMSFNPDATGTASNRTMGSFDTKENCNTKGDGPGTSEYALGALKDAGYSNDEIKNGKVAKGGDGHYYAYDKNRGKMVDLGDTYPGTGGGSSSSGSVYRPSNSSGSSVSFPSSYPTNSNQPLVKDPPTPTPTPKPVHTHTYTTTCTPLNATQHQTKTYCTGCGS